VIRYFALATVIVVSVVVLVTAWQNRELIRIRIAPTTLPMSPRPGDSSSSGPRPNVPFQGDAPWALSALPGCLSQISVATGPLDYVRAHVPAGATPVVPPATLIYGDCTISVIGDEAYVRRGNDRFHIPANVRFYRGPALLAVLRRSGTGNELRVYLLAH
jgi:hypothetical protein